MLSNNLKRKLFYAIILIPIVDVFANITTNYFPPNTLNPGFFRMLFMGGVILIFIFNYKAPSRVTTILYIFLAYNLIRVLMNENAVYPLTNYVKMTFSCLMLPIGFVMIKDMDSLLKLLKAYMIALFILCANYPIANYFKLGESAYIEESFYLGGSGAGLTNEIAVFVICGIVFFMINKNKKWNYFTAANICASVIIILLVLRRGAFITLGAGLIPLFYYSKFNRRFVKYILIAAVLICSVLPFYSDIFLERYEIRSESREGSILNYEVENRYLETFWVMDELKKSTDVLFWGTHNLNSAEVFFGRELHVGYMAILHGSGIIGAFLFIIFIVTLLRNGRYYYKLTQKNDTNKNLIALFIALIFALLGFLVSSRLHVLSVTTPVFLMLGAILSVLARDSQDSASR